MPKLKLFSSNGCPFCRKVTSFMAANNMTIETEDPFSDTEAMFAFKDLTGKTQVPCLLIDGKPMHESNDIIAWLDQNWDA